MRSVDVLTYNKSFVFRSTRRKYTEMYNNLQCLLLKNRQFLSFSYSNKHKYYTCACVINIWISLVICRLSLCLKHV